MHSCHAIAHNSYSASQGVLSPFPASAVRIAAYPSAHKWPGTLLAPRVFIVAPLENPTCHQHMLSQSCHMIAQRLPRCPLSCAGSVMRAPAPVLTSCLARFSGLSPNCASPGDPQDPSACFTKVPSSFAARYSVCVSTCAGHMILTVCFRASSQCACMLHYAVQEAQIYPDPCHCILWQAPCMWLAAGAHKLI